MKHKVQLILFDLDGTLINTMGAFADLAGELIKSFYGWTFECGRKRYLETSGIPFFQQLEVLLPGHEKNRAVAQLFEHRKIQAFMRERVSEQTLETLHTLRDREIRTAISSNNFQALVREFVRRENVPVDLALGYRPGFCKGQPHFAHVRDYFRIPYSDMLFVGDSLTDAATARTHTIRFVAKLGTFAAHDFLGLDDRTAHVPMIYEIHELLDMLEEL